MSDTPKPKPGSLRDRIAAFENKAASSAPQPSPPPPRPKPAGFATWKPKQPSPPSSPAAPSSPGADAAKAGPAGMSAADAKESITRGGSLKERMAALQGKGAFGAPAPPVTPKPTEKPKWKPPPPVVSPPPIDDESSDGAKSLAEPAVSPPSSIKSPPPVRSPKSTSEEETVGLEDTLTKDTSAEDDENATVEVDPEEEERQRRAAIAARMARLGGARLGMAPPILGVKPNVPAKKLQQPKEEERPLSEQVASPEVAASPPTEEPADASNTNRTEDVSAPTEPASIHSPESDASQTSRSPPTAMPVPAVPRRAAPPKRKPAKQPVAAPIVLDDEANEGETATKSPSIAEEVAAPAIAAEPDVKTDAAEDPSVQFEETGVDQPPVEHDESADADEQPPAGTVPTSPPRDAPLSSKDEEPETPQQEEDEDEEARRRRVAEKLAKMGGVQPFGFPPVPLRKPSGGSVRSIEGLASPPTSPPPPPFRKPSLRKDSADSADASPPVRKSSAGSIKALDTEEVIAEPESTITSVIPEEEDAPALSREEPKRTSVEIEHGNEQEKQDENVFDDNIDDRTGASGSHGSELTPQLPNRVPIAVTSELRAGEPSAIDYKSYSQVDPDIVASAFPPPPLTTPPAVPVSAPIFASSVSTTSPPSHPIPLPPSAPLPPRVVVEQQPRSPHADKLAGPSPPRRIVPDTPEESESGNERDDDETESNLELSASTLFIPPPPARTTGASGALQANLGEKQDDGGESEPPLRVPARSVIAPGTGGKLAGIGGAYDDTDGESNASGAPLPVPLPVCGPGGARLGYSPEASERSLDDGEDERDRRGAGVGGAGIVSSPLARPTRAAPPPPPAEEGSGSEYGDDLDQEQETEEPVLRTRPFSGANEEAPLIVRPPTEPEEEQEEVEMIGEPVASPPLRGLPSPPEHPLPRGQTPLVEEENQEQETEVEVLDEEEGDPIDPAFHSPSRRASTIHLEPGPPSMSLPSAASLSPPSAPLPKAPPAERTEANQPPDEEEDAEKTRRQTIAERMARLGGIQFGAAPLPGGIPRPSVPRRTQTEDEEPADDGEAEREEQPDEEEDERARRERIAAKLAGMGGMRIGMMPMNMPPSRSQALKGEAPSAEPARSSSTRAIPPSRPPLPHALTQPSAESESDRGSANISDDGVKVEAEESEMEEVGYENVEDVEEPVVEQEVPPPVPARGSRSGTLSASTPGRPPVPTGLPFRRASGQSASGVSVESARKVSGQQHSEYVLVDEPRAIDEEEEDVPPPPPARPADRVLPTRTSVPVPRSSSSKPTMADSISSQWELPAIPSSSLDLDSGGGDLSLSWSEASVDERGSGVGRGPGPQTPQAVPVPPPPVRAPEALQLSADELMAMWGRVGVQICEIATTMYDRSKKTVVGDGTYKGFVDTVLAQVPNASKPMMPSVPYGYLMYLQNGTSVQKRASEIMPGDVIELVDARFKGYKGLQSYQMHVGAAETGGAVVGIVSEFDHKKCKTRVFHANQHVGQQAVEAVSYRLDDLKSGLVKVYRVLEA